MSNAPEIFEKTAKNGYGCKTCARCRLYDKATMRKCKTCLTGLPNGDLLYACWTKRPANIAPVESATIPAIDTRACGRNAGREEKTGQF